MVVGPMRLLVFIFAVSIASSSQIPVHRLITAPVNEHQLAVLTGKYASAGSRSV